MKENKHHPMAAQHTLETSFWEQMHTISSVQIVDDIVGVFCSAHGPALAIWNWHTGEQLVVGVPSPSPRAAPASIHPSCLTEVR